MNKIENTDKNKIITFLFTVFIGLTLLNLLVHVQRSTSIKEIESGNNSMELSYKDLKIECQLVKVDRDYEATLYFYSEDSEIRFLNLELVMADLDLSRIYFQGHIESKKYKSQNEFPDTLIIQGESKSLPTTIRYIFIKNNSSSNLELTLNSDVYINDQNKINISKQFKFIEENYFELKPFDLHSDYTYLLIQYQLVISLILVLIKIILLLFNKYKVNK